MESSVTVDIDAELQKWRRLDLKAAQERGDRAASEIEYRSQTGFCFFSGISLSQQIKEARQLDQSISGGRGLMHSMLMRLQSDIRNTESRNSSVEQGFRDLHSSIKSFPDPSVLLDYIARLEDMASENAELRQRIAQYEQLGERRAFLIVMGLCVAVSVCWMVCNFLT